MRLLIVRHGESKGNATGDYSVLTHDSLSLRGQEQAVSLVEHLQSHTFDQILVSPLQRALETVAPYLAATEQHAEVWPEIAEACWQEPTGGPAPSWNSEPATLPKPIAGLFRFPNGEAVRPAEGESYAEGLCRAHAAAQRIQDMTADPDLSILMVSHGHFIRELLNLMLETRRAVGFAQDNCGMTLLTYDGAWSLNYCNRPSH
jgi:broad specificity phosphatase PhoE